MKKNKFTLGWFFIGLLMAFCATACSDDDDQAVQVTFPEKQFIGGAAQSVHALTFDAAADWQLTSSSTWCAFQTGDGQKEYALAGKAGKQTVSVLLSSEGQGYESSVALITLAMNGKEAVIAEVTRNAVNRQLTLYKEVNKGEWVALAQGEALQAPRFTGLGKEEESFANYKVCANFRFAASNRPDWLTVKGGSIVGAVNQEVEFGIKVVENKPGYYKYAQEGQLTFQDEEGKCCFTFPVRYEGMDPEALKLEGPNQWNWEVAMDGQTFVQATTGIAGSEEVKNKYHKFVEFNVTAFNDEFEAIFVERVEEWGMTRFKTSILDPEFPEDFVDWMHLKKYENGKVRVTVDGGEQEREGYVFVFPKALYEKIAADPFDADNGLFELNQETFTQELKYKYTENNLLMNFLQKEQKQAGGSAPLFQVKLYGFQDLPCAEVTNSFIVSYIQETFGADAEKQQVQAGKGEYILVNPFLSAEEWDYNGVEIWDDFGSNITEKIKPEAAMDGEDMAVGVSIPADWDESYLYVAFKVGSAYAKVLVIAPKI